MACQNEYPVNQSPLFKIKTKSKLAHYLQVTPKELIDLTRDDHYSVWSDNGREIQAPKKRLKKVHGRLKDLLSKIKTPEWLISGKKGKSYIDNAKVHRSSDYLLNVDITGFYKNTSIERIRQLFIYEFQMNTDVAYLLAELVTWSGIVPTGSPASQLLAYWANKKTFDRIHEIAVSRNLQFSVYVDDLSFSGNVQISSELPYLIAKELKQVGLSLKRKKTKFFFKKDFKSVTGVGLTKTGDLAVLNSKRKKILDKFPSLTRGNAEAAKRSMKGSLVSARQIEPNFMATTYSALGGKSRRSQSKFTSEDSKGQ